MERRPVHIGIILSAAQRADRSPRGFNITQEINTRRANRLCSDEKSDIILGFLYKRPFLP